jgi:gamma-glutamyl phosphate reductase
VPTVLEVCAAAKAASPAIAQASTEMKNAALEAMAAALDGAHEEILEANAADLEARGPRGSPRRSRTASPSPPSASTAARRACATSSP